MPTPRTYTFLIAAFIFYSFANQTQVGWLYVITALMVGVVLAGYVLNRRALRGIAAERRLHHEDDSDLHEGDEIRITLEIHNGHTLPAAHLEITEACPLADPQSEAAESRMFVPLLPERVSFSYETTVYRRGLHRFPPLKLASRAPFGFFRREHDYPLESPTLIYSELRKLTHFALLDRQPAAELTVPRAGLGSEVIGVRPYRPGDSPRHIHWRSVARRGELVSKEFAEESQPGVTLVLDRYQPLRPIVEMKHTPFEMAVKCATSMAEYALRQGYPLYLTADSAEMALPQGAMAWDGLMQYLARVQPRTQSRLADVLHYQPLQQFVAVALCWPDDAALEAIVALKQRGYRVFVALPDAPTYVLDPAPPAQNFAAALASADIDVRLIPQDADWAAVLSAAAPGLSEIVGS